MRRCEEGEEGVSSGEEERDGCGGGVWGEEVREG